MAQSEGERVEEEVFLEKLLVQSALVVPQSIAVGAGLELLLGHKNLSRNRLRLDRYC